MASTDELCRKRDAASGVISRVSEECELLRRAPVDSIEVAMVERKLESVERASEAFLEQHDALTLDNEDITNEHHKDALGAHHDLVHGVRDVLAGLRNKAKTAILIRELEMMLTDLEESVSKSGYKPTLDREMGEAADCMQLIRKARGQPGAQVSDEINALSKSATSRFRALQDLQGSSKEIKEIKVTPTSTVIDYKQGLSLEIPPFDGTTLGWKRSGIPSSQSWKRTPI